MKLVTTLTFLSLIFTASANAADDPLIQEDAINALQLKLTPGLRPSGQHQLQEAQRAWLQFRETECRYRQANYPLMTSVGDCRRLLTSERLSDMNRQLEWLHGWVGNIDQSGNTCRAAVGQRASEQLVRQCLSVTTDAQPPCNAEHSCEIIKREIRRGCETIEKDSLPFCADYQ